MVTLCKIVLIGDGAVGKTSLRRSFMGKGFQKAYMMTIGADFATKKISIKDEKLKFQIWDLAGQPRFSSVRDIYYRGALGALLVYDITRPETFENTITWIKECFNAAGKPIPTVLLGNKIDLRDEVPNSLSPKHGTTLAKKISEVTAKKGFDVKYLETSAATGENVQRAFHILGKSILNVIEKERERMSNINKMALKSRNRVKKPRSHEKT